MILEVWGNGIDVIVKYLKKEGGDPWFAASKWLGNNSNMNDKWLIKHGYRRLKNYE